MNKNLILRGRVVRVSAYAILASAVCTSVLHAADSTVPLHWNVAPMRAGAYLESFESAFPTWAHLSGGSSATDTFPTMTGSALPTRANAWFDANAKVLQLSTDGTVLTNTLMNAAPAPAAISFASTPVYIDTRVRFDALAETPAADLLANCKLAFYVDSASKLVVVHNGGSTTYATPLNTNQWYQVTAKLLNGKCDIKLNDVTILTDLELTNSGTANQLDALNFYGTGYMDELYVSYGAPDYAVEGPVTAIAATLPADGDNVPGDEEQTRINRWLSEQTGLTSLEMTQDELSQAYLVDADLTGAAGPVDCDFGISAIDIATPTNLKITAKLTVNEVAKVDSINGRIQLLGKVARGDSWTTLEGAITPSNADFINGEAVYFYTIPAGGYKFFKPTIVP